MATESEQWRLSMSVGAPYGTSQYYAIVAKRNEERQIENYEREMADKEGLTLEQWRARKIEREAAKQKELDDLKAAHEAAKAEELESLRIWRAEKAAAEQSAYDAVVAQGRKKAETDPDWTWALHAPARYVHDAMLTLTK